MPYGFDWVDAFADRPFAGNGCAVVYEAGGLAAETCQAVVRETGLVECTFLEPSDRADVKIRYFMADREIPFAGHPTVASVASLRDRGLVAPGKITVETGAGVLPVEISADGWIAMTQIRPEFGPDLPAEMVAASVGLQPGDIAHPPRVVSTGLPFCITVVSDHAALARARLDGDGLAALRGALTARLEPGAAATMAEPFLVAPGGVTEEGSTFARLLLAPPLPPEDPFTGSATGAMAAFLWAEGLIDRADFVAEQGHWLGRPGRARVQVLGPRDDISGVRVAGQGYVLMRGFLNLA